MSAAARTDFRRGKRDYLVRKVLLARLGPAALALVLGRGAARATDSARRAAYAALLALLASGTPAWWAFLQLAGNVGRLKAQDLPEVHLP